ncbi:hypothetical protein C4K37_5243 [Pseudomonas chlororaphis subsp. piscium]|nr:hypothetical protein C4K37_5243 [Pseudomonas chlororaphis subsp. piscium]AZC46158.1 hypothetical protein C4K36_5256 [Pseudomonas chlororaphis subsp. piscium]
MVAQKHVDSQWTSIEKTHRKAGKGKFTNIVGRKASTACGRGDL